jgi:hypothetical protein
MSTEQRMEKQFFLNLISLVNEVQGYNKLTSQVKNRKSAWCKQIKNPRQDSSALAFV